MTPSKYQQAVLDAVHGDTCNLMVQAVAGSGKTATLKMICELVSKQPLVSVLAIAFNKEIAKALAAKLPPSVTSTTMHSYGLQVLRDNVPKLTIDAHGKKVRDVMESMFGKTRSLPDTMKEYVEELKNLISKVRGTYTDTENWAEIEAVAVEYDVDLDALYAAKKPTEIAADVHTIVKTLRENTSVVDFDDMLDLVVHYRYKSKVEYSLVLVDESQDLNRLQAEFVGLILEGKPRAKGFDGLDMILGPTAKLESSTPGRPSNNRVVLVGDTRQAIYKFRGADAKSMQNLAEKFQTKSLPLSICYRCPVSVVELAQKVVGPIIEPSPTAKEGTVRFNQASDLDALMASLKDGDMVMCRTNAPLMGAALSCLRSGKKVHVRGKADLGNGLVKLIKAAQENAALPTISSFLEALRDIVGDQVKAALEAEKLALATILSDKYDCIAELAQDARCPEDIVEFIKRVFEDNAAAGVTFSSIHRAKGLEADHAIILQPDKLPHPMAYRSNNVQAALEQERNLTYVAITRAMDQLTLQPLPGERSTPFPELQDAFNDAAARRASRGLFGKPLYGDFLPSGDTYSAIDF